MKRVVCLGSALDVDCIGWQLAELLSGRVAARGEEYDIKQCATPLALPGLLKGVDALMIVDALKGCKAGVVRVVEHSELLRDGAVSTHGFDLVTLLETARVLGELPARCVIVGIGVGETDLEPVVPDTDLVEQIHALMVAL